MIIVVTSTLGVQVLAVLVKAAQKEKGSAEAVVFYKKMEGDYNRSFYCIQFQFDPPLVIMSGTWQNTVQERVEKLQQSVPYLHIR